MIIGKKINLKNVERKNINQLREWRNNPELRRYFREHKLISEDDQVKWYENKVLSDPKQYNFEIHSNHLISVSL